MPTTVKARRQGAQMPTTVNAIDPWIRVKNVARSAEWYRRMLGFSVEQAVPDAKKPAFIRLSNGATAIMISDGSEALAGRRVPKATLEAISARKAQRVVSFYLHVDDGVDALYRSVRRKGAKIVQPPTDQPSGEATLSSGTQTATRWGWRSLCDHKIGSA